MGSHSSYELDCIQDSRLVVVTQLEVIEKEEGVVALNIPTGPLKVRSGLELVPRCDPSTYQPISR